MKWNNSIVCSALALALVATTVMAQEGRRGGGRGGPGGSRGFGAGMMGGGMGLAGLLSVDKVQEELELVEDQVTEVTSAVAEFRQGGRRGGPGAAGAPGGGRGGRGGRGAGGEAPDREQFAAAMRQREQEFRGKVSEILLPHQMDRLDQIHLQTRGVAALADPEVIAKLQFTDEQTEKMTSAREELETTLRERMREAFQGGGAGGEGRQQLMAQMTEMRREIETKVMALLTDEQKKTFEEMKGEPFEMPPAQFGGLGGGRGGRGGEGAPRGGGRGGQGGRGGRGGN